ncbi:MAG: hypothetical protein EBS33_05025, partial [Alphaproteobacteria bacterium]|nr:hypothetical protein [Alphaproteobacteria bacterium]
MATYYGFSTQELGLLTRFTEPGKFGGVAGITRSVPITKKFTLTDENLIIRDLLNAFNIKQGDKVGQPAYGSTLWGFLFEPNSTIVLGQIEDEVRRIISQDPRIILGSVYINNQENGILLELEIA